MEGPAVSPLPTHNSNLRHPSPLVIPTEAKRRDLQCALRLSPILPGRDSGIAYLSAYGASPHNR